MWVALAGEGKLVRLDPTTGDTVSVIVGANPDSVVVDGDVVWVSVTFDHRVVQLSAGPQPKVLRRFSVGSRPEGLAVTDRAVWVANSGDGSLTQIIKATGVTRTVPNVGRSPVDVAIGAGAVWVADGRNGSVTRVNGGTRPSSPECPVGPNPRAVAIVGRDVWVVTAGDGRAWRIDSDTNTVADHVAVGGPPATSRPTAATSGSPTGAADASWRSTRRRARSSTAQPVEGQPLGVAVDDSAVFASVFDAGAVARLPR